MRILFPTLARFPSHEAPAIQVANMAQAFAELGHDVALVVPAAADGAPTADLPADELFGFTPRFHVVTLSRTIHRGQSYLHAARIARMARDADLVFSRNLRACLLPALRGVPTVFEAHTLSGIDGRQDRWVLERLLHAPGLRGIVAISAALAEDLTAVLGVPADRIIVAHDAVRPQARSATGPGTEAGAVAARTRSDGPPLRVGYTGSLFPGKGAEAIPELAMRCPWAEFHVAGGPPQAAAALAARTAASGVRNVVVHGPIAPSEATRIQRSCDMLIAPFARRIESDSGHDIARWTSPMKVFEYMASGRPIVISDLPVLREVLRPDVDALMVPPEDLDALARAIGRLADDPDLRRRLADSALARVEEEFTWDIRARRTLARFAPTDPAAVDR